MKNEATVPLQPGREYDQPAGPHTSGAAALRVPCSEADRSIDFDRGDESNTALIEAEPRLQPDKLMEAGDEEDPETYVRLRELDRPLRVPSASEQPFMG